MGIRIRVFQTLLLLIAFNIEVNAQCGMYELSIEEKVDSSIVVIEGKVLSSESFWNDSQTLIYTSHLIEVYKVFKGTGVSSQVQIVTLGGIVGDKMLKVHPGLDLEVGQVGIFTLISSTVGNPTNNSIDSYTCYSDLQGFFNYDLEDHTASTPFKKYTDITGGLYSLIENIVKKSYEEIKAFDPNEGRFILKAGGSITSFSPTSISAGTKSVLTINGSGFGATRGSSVVQFRNADDGGSTYIEPQAVEYVSWSDTKIEVQVPDAAGTGTIRVIASSTITSSAELNVTFAESTIFYNNNIYHPDHVNIDSDAGLTWRMHTNFESNTAAKESIIRAINTWRCATRINWKLGATTTVNSTGRDGTNVIRYDVGSELSAGVLGTCYSYYSGCSTSNWYVEELDMVIDGGSNWEYGPAAPTGSRYDFESTMLHELGHGHQLLHVIDNNDVMNYGIANATSKRTLNAYNIEGGNDIMSRSVIANSCSPGPMEYLVGQCAIGAPAAAFSASPLSGCANLSVSFTDNSTENPTSWFWDVDNDGVTDYTSQNPTHVYSGSGTFSVKLIVSNANGSDTLLKTNYITVESSPVADFTNIISDDVVDFTNTSVNADIYDWSFGDGLTSSETSPSYQYSTSGTYTVSLIATNTCGSDTISNEVTVGFKPSAGFSVNTNTGCSPYTVNFTDTTTENPISWVWDIDNDGIVDYTTQNPSHTYTKSGNYSVKLITTNGIGVDTVIKENFIVIDTLPVSNFSSTVTIDTAKFSNTSLHAISFHWDFGDGTLSTDSNPSHIYESVGSYTVSLIAINNCGTDTVSQLIPIDSVHQIPSAGFSVNAYSGCVPLTLSFSDTSKGSPTSWSWDMNNDGIIDYTSQNPNHTYTSQGAQTVKLIVGNVSGFDTIIQTNFIVLDSLPIAIFSSISVKDSVYFTNTSQAGTDYVWDFGDGGTSLENSPAYKYLTYGTYTVSLIVSNTCGSDTVLQAVTVSENVIKPSVDFSIDVNSGCVPLTVNFTDNSTENPTSWAWDVNNDGTIDYTSQNPSHVYTASGTYTVRLITSNGGGADTLIKNNLIVIDNLPVANFNNLVNVDTVFLTNASSNSTTYHWDLGNSNSSFAQDTTYVYADTGVYTIRLIAYNACASDTTSQIIKIDSVSSSISTELLPVSAFTADVTQGCAPLSVTFSDESVGIPNLWKWDVDNDGTIDYTHQNPTHVYTNAGVYSVKLVVENSDGIDSLVKIAYIQVDDVPEAGFLDTLSGNTVFVTNTSINASSYLWDFGDSSDSDKADDSHSYANSGTYVITLTANNACGSDSHSGEVLVLETSLMSSIVEEALTLYPNPTAGFVYLSIANESESIERLSIYNFLGEQVNIPVVTLSSTQMQFDFTAVEDGVYCLVADINGSIISQKILVQK